MYEDVPFGHSVWAIRWFIGTRTGGYVIGVIVDAEDAMIIIVVRGVTFL